MGGGRVPPAGVGKLSFGPNEFRHLAEKEL
jgi:hypothetical protein